MHAEGIPADAGGYPGAGGDVQDPTSPAHAQPLPAIAPLPIPPLYNQHHQQQPGVVGGAASVSAQRSQSTSSSGSGERMTPSGTIIPSSAAIPPSSNPLSPNPNSSQPITPTAPNEQHHHLGFGAGGFNFADPTGALAGLGMGGASTSGMGAGGNLLHSHFMANVGRLPTSSAHLSMGRRYPCKLCTAMFDSKAELQIHTQVHMREAKPYKCTHCPKSFANSSYLSQHMRIHLGIKPFGPCQYCGRKFTQLSHLQQHLRTHTGEKPYKCRYGGCEKAFSQLSNLQSHSRCHQADKPFKCNSCYKCFTQEQELMDHIPKHKESKHLKIHICPYCGKSYTQATYLAKHMTKHSDRRDRDIRLREMMREEPTQMWGGPVQREAQICAVHGIPDSCGDASPSALSYSFPTPPFAVPASVNNCNYPAANPNADPSAFTRFNALSALTGRGLQAPPQLSAQNRSAYFTAYDSIKNASAAAQQAGGFPSAPYTSLIRLDDIRQYAGGQAGPSAQEQFNMLNPKRDSY